MIRALLVHNPDAGTDPVPREEIERVLRAAGLDTIYCEHRGEDLDAALRGSFDLVVAAGGDGTVADVVSSLDRTEVPIGILPLGGSNNIANALGVDGAWASLPPRWSLARWARLDRCQADGPWGRKTFVEALGSGVLTDAVDEADEDPATPEEKQRNGRAAFRKALRKADPFGCRIVAADWRWSGDCLMVEVMNMAFAGSRLALAGQATPGDGLLDIFIVEPGDREALLAWAEAPDLRPCPLPTRKAASVQLTVHERPFRLDDRCPNEHLAGTVDIEVRPSWVRVLTIGDDGG